MIGIKFNLDSGYFLDADYGLSRKFQNDDTDKKLIKICWLIFTAYCNWQPLWPLAYYSPLSALFLIAATFAIVFDQVQYFLVIPVTWLELMILTLSGSGYCKLKKWSGRKFARLFFLADCGDYYSSEYCCGRYRRINCMPWALGKLISSRRSILLLADDKFDSIPAGNWGAVLGDWRISDLFAPGL